MHAVGAKVVLLDVTENAVQELATELGPRTWRCSRASPPAKIWIGRLRGL
ncbi:hypothetical protein P4105_03570 [Pseudomonas aeruginosa]|nr:hypothetical protein [Pseudomonas aeruginosa]